jgi:hypothetical protein
MRGIGAGRGGEAHNLALKLHLKEIEIGKGNYTKYEYKNKEIIFNRPVLY